MGPGNEGEPTAVPAAKGSIELREPRQAVKANFFWGILFGGLLLLPAVFAPAETAPLTRIGSGLAGFAVLAAMGLLIGRNRSRRIRLRDGIVEVSSAFGSSRFSLAEVASVTERDIRKELRDFDRGDAPKFHTTGLDTLPEMVKYELCDRDGRVLLSLDRDSEPAEALGRFLLAARSAVASRGAS
jgi:hypothetical protein